MKTNRFLLAACNLLAVALVISCSNGGSQYDLSYSSKNEDVSSSSSSSSSAGSSFIQNSSSKDQ